MIKTTIEWYTLDEKLPFDGELYGMNDYVEVMCIVEIHRHEDSCEVLRWLDGKLMHYYDGEFIDSTKRVKYWAYVPKIGVE